MKLFQLLIGFISLHSYVTFMNFYILIIDLCINVASDQIISFPMFSESRLMLVPKLAYNVFSPVIVN